MKTIWLWTQTAFTAAGGVVGWYLGGMDGFLYALIAFVVVDYLTGVLCAIVKKELSSEIGAKGIAKKVAIFLLIGIANLVDVNVLHDGSTLRTAIIFFYLANEGLSVMENSITLGLPVPEVLKNALTQIKAKSEDKNGKDGEAK